MDNLNSSRAWKSAAVNFLIFFHSRSIRHHFYLPSLSPFISGFSNSDSRSYILFVSYKIVISGCFLFLSGFVCNLYMKAKDSFPWFSPLYSYTWPLLQETNTIMKTICHLQSHRLFISHNHNCVQGIQGIYIRTEV